MRAGVWYDIELVERVLRAVGEQEIGEVWTVRASGRRVSCPWVL